MLEGIFSRSALSLARSEAAAARAVDDLIIELIQNGASPSQAKSIALAAQEYLVRAPGFERRATLALGGAGFSLPEIESLTNELNLLGLTEAAA